MIASLRESKANLSKLVERASAGEEVLLTVRGRPKARLVATAKSDMAGWAKELATHLRKQPVRHAPSAGKNNAFTCAPSGAGEPFGR